MLDPKFTPFPEIKTGRLMLRRITMQDAPEIWALRSDEKVMQFIDREKPQNLAEAEAWIQQINGYLDNNTAITWAITFLEEGPALIGTIGFWRISNQHYRSEVGYLLDTRYWNRGIMKEALLSVIEYGFGPMMLHSIEARINPDNKASAALLEKTGFVREAYFKEDYFFRGKFLDTAVYSLLAS
jgi:[ribosomal protein S5]-alanine N-acetyltransferase